MTVAGNSSSASRHLSAVTRLTGLFPGVGGIMPSLDIAVDAALRYRFSEVGIEHLLLGLLAHSGFCEIVAKAGGRPEDVQLSLVESFEQHARFQDEDDQAALGVSETILAIGLHITMLENEGDRDDELSRELFTSLIDAVGKSRVAEVAFEHGGASRLLDSRHGEDLLEKVFDDVDFLDLGKPSSPAAQAVPNEGWRSGDAKGPRSSAAEMPREPDTKSSAAASSSPGSQKGSQKDNAKSVADAVAVALRDLGKAARDGDLDPCIGRDAEIDKIISALRRRRKGSVLIYGDAGVGKTAVAEGVALRLRASDVEYALARRPFYELSLTSLVADTKYRGDFEARMTHLIERLSKERAIVFIDEIHMLMGSGSTYGRGMDGANILKPALARGEVTVIGATTPHEMRELRRDTALMRRFEPLPIREPNRAETAQILRQAGWTYLDFHDLDMDEDVIDEICRICDQYQPERRFPDKAFDLLDAACVMTREISRIPKFASARAKVTTGHVQAAASRMGIRRPTRPTAALARKLEEIRTSIASRLKGQDSAIDALRDAVFGAALDISSSGTKSSILLYGPEGCGKSTAIEQFSRHMGLPLVQLDMQSLGARGLHHLIGSAGQGGMERSGVLVDAADAHPEMVLHIKGVDKADPSIRDFLASIAKDGTFQAADGRTVSLRGAWCFFTARQSDRGSFGFGCGASVDDSRPDLGDTLDRQLSQAIRFDAVTPDATRSIVLDAGSHFVKTWAEMGISVELSDDLLDGLSDRVSTGEQAAAVFKGEAVGCLTAALLAHPGLRRAVLDLDEDGRFRLSEHE